MKILQIIPADPQWRVTCMEDIPQDERGTHYQPGYTRRRVCTDWRVAVWALVDKGDGVPVVVGLCPGGPDGELEEVFDELDGASYRFGDGYFRESVE